MEKFQITSIALEHNILDHSLQTSTFLLQNRKLDMKSSEQTLIPSSKESSFDNDFHSPVGSCEIFGNGVDNQVLQNSEANFN